MRLCDDIEHRGRLHWWVRKGLVTDGASIPLIVAWIVGGPFEGRHRRAAIFHDAYYRRAAHEVTLWAAFRSRRRAVVDRMLFEVACADGSRPWKAMLIYVFVRPFGFRAWRAHSRRRRDDAIRYSPAARVDEVR